MGLFGNKNSCCHSNNCPFGTEPCNYCVSKNFDECSIYRQLNGDDNPCPIKHNCSGFPHSCLGEAYESCFRYLHRDDESHGSYNAEDDGSYPNDDIVEDIDDEKDVDTDEDKKEHDEKNMIEDKRYPGWTIAELRDHMVALLLMSRTTIRRKNTAIDLRDGYVRVATLGDDKKWSEWKTYDAPKLEVGDGKLVMMWDNSKPLLWTPDNSAMEIWVYDYDDDKILERDYNVFKQPDYGRKIIDLIGDGNYGSIHQLVMIPYADPDAPYYTTLKVRMNLVLKIQWNGQGDKQEVLDRMKDEVDMAYISGDWVKYYPLKSERYGCWLPKQEIEYIDKLIAKREALEQKPAKKEEKGKNQRSAADAESRKGSSQGKTILKAMLCIFAIMVLGSFLLIGGVLYFLFSDSSKQPSEETDATEMVEDSRSDIPIDHKVAEKLETKYDLVMYEDGLYQVVLNDYYGLCDKEGNEICKPQFDYIGSLENGLIEVYKGDKSGYINSDGKIVIPCKYDYVYFDEGLIVCVNDGVTTYFDKEGNKREKVDNSNY